MTVIRTAGIQLKVSLDKLKNLDNVRRIIDTLCKHSAELIILPEMFNSPYQTDSFADYAEEEGGYCWHRVSRLAEEYRVHIIAGSMPEREGDKIYNTSYVFDRNGNQIIKHRKVHLFDINIEGGLQFRESEVLSPGNQVTVFDTEYGTIGLCVCYDFRFPELSRKMVEQGAKIIVVPAAFNMTTGPAHWEILFRTRAVDNQVYTVGVAPARNSRSSYTSWGHTIMVDPWGNILEQMDEKEGFIIQDLDLELVDKVRRELPLLAHRRTDVY